MKFRFKILAAIWGVVLVLQIVSVVIFSYLTRQQIRSNFADQVRSSYRTVSALNGLQGDEDVKSCQLITDESRVKAVAETNDPNTAAQLTLELSRNLSSDLLILTNAKGAVLSCLVDGAPRKISIDAFPTISSALTGAPEGGFWYVDSMAVRGASSPIMVGEDIVGTLTTGRKVKGSDLDGLKLMTGADIVLLVDTTIVRSTIPLRAISEFAPAAPEWLKPHTSTVYDEAPDVVPLTGLNDVYLGAYCGVTAGTPASRGFGYLILKPTQDAIAQALDPLTKVFFGLSVLVLLITAAIGYLISASITRPIAALVRGTAEVSKGNYDYRIDVQTGGELNFLAERFGEMSASLKNNIGELAERNLELKEIISSAADGIVVYDKDLRYTVWNPFMEKMTGISAESVLGKDGRTQVPQLYSRSVSTLLQKALTGETVRTPDMFFQIPESGKAGWFVATYGPRRSTGGEIIGVIGVITDLTERRRAEEAMRSSEEKYRNVFEQSKDTIFISTPEGKLLDINPAGVELFGYTSKEELMSVDISHDLYLNARDRERFQRSLEERGFVRDHQLELKKKDGTKSTVLETTTVVRDESGAIVAYRGIMRDITERQQLEERLRQAHKMESIGNLAGGIAHDFNNILGIILGYASILDRGPADETKLTTSLESIKKAALRGADLVKQILTFARRSDVLLESVKVNPVIEELRGLLLETFPKTIAIDLRLDPKLPSIVGDHGQIHQSVLNLCVNARDAMPKGGSITVSTSVSSGDLVRDIFPEADDEQYVCLGVTDTGTGMSEETRSKIFEPFFTTKERGKGTGLGLAVVYGIVRSHRGFIDVRSTPGTGTTFNLYFPVPLRRVVNPRKADGVGEIPRGKETILLVEDEEMLLEFTRSLIESYGYQTIVATDGVEAIERFRSNHANIALVLSDMGLPKLGGLEALIEMKKIDPGVKAILASGYLDPQVRAEMIKVEAKDFLQKPYDPKELLRTIRSVIDRAPV